MSVFRAGEGLLSPHDAPPRPALSNVGGKKAHYAPEEEVIIYATHLEPVRQTLAPRLPLSSLLPMSARITTHNHMTGFFLNPRLELFLRAY